MILGRFWPPSWKVALYEPKNMSYVIFKKIIWPASCLVDQMALENTRFEVCVEKSASFTLSYYQGFGC